MTPVATPPPEPTTKTIRDCRHCGLRIYLSTLDNKWFHWQTARPECPAGTTETP